VAWAGVGCKEKIPMVQIEPFHVGSKCPTEGRKLGRRLDFAPGKKVERFSEDR